MLERFRSKRVVLAVLGATLFASAVSGTESERKVVNRVTPIYPSLARQMNVSGKVRIEAVIAANGTVKSMKAMGGHPLLIESATEALRKWRYAPGPETTVIIEFRFRTDLGPPTAKEQP